MLSARVCRRYDADLEACARAVAMLLRSPPSKKTAAGTSCGQDMKKAAGVTSTNGDDGTKVKGDSAYVREYKR